MSFEDERHQIFKEQVYPLAVLPRKEFQEELDKWKENNPDLWNDEIFKMTCSKYQLRDFIKNYKWR